MPKLFLFLAAGAVASSFAFHAHPNPKTDFRYNLRDFYDTAFCDTARIACDYRIPFRKALERLYDNGGGTLEVNPGRYKVCGSIEFHPENGPSAHDSVNVIPTLTIRGAGGETGATLIYCDSIFSTAGMKKPAFFKFMLPPKGDDKPYGVHMEHLAISGEGSASAYEKVAGIYTQNRSSTILNDVTFRHLRRGVWIQYGGRYLIDYCKFSKINEIAVDGSESGNAVVSRCEFAAIGFGSARNGSAAIFAGGDLNIRENVIGTCWNAAILLRQGGRKEGSTVTESGELSVVNNQFDSNRHILVFDSTRVGDSITNCEFSGNKVAGWTGYAKTDFAGATGIPVMASFAKGKHIAGLMIKNNRFAGLSMDGIGFDIEYGKDIQITGNTFAQYWSYTRQYLLGTLFRFKNSTQINISDNKAEMGWNPGGKPIRPLIADFSNAEGIFKFNTFNNAARGIIQDPDSRVTFFGNIGSPSYAALFNDTNGWPTVPNNSSILISEFPGGGALRKGDYIKTADIIISNGQWGDLLTLRIPTAGTIVGKAAGGVFKLKTYVAGHHAGIDYSATLHATLTASDIKGPSGHLKYQVKDTSSMDMSPLDWVSTAYSFSSPVQGKGYKEVTLRLMATSPGATDLKIRLQVEFEEWGGIKLK